MKVEGLYSSQEITFIVSKGNPQIEFLISKEKFKIGTSLKKKTTFLETYAVSFRKKILCSFDAKLGD